MRPSIDPVASTVPDMFQSMHSTTQDFSESGRLCDNTVGVNASKGAAADAGCRHSKASGSPNLHPRTDISMLQFFSCPMMHSVKHCAAVQIVLYLLAMSGQAWLYMLCHAMPCCAMSYHRMLRYVIQAAGATSTGVSATLKPESLIAKQTLTGKLPCSEHCLCRRPHAQPCFPILCVKYSHLCSGGLWHFCRLCCLYILHFSSLLL